MHLPRTTILCTTILLMVTSVLPCRGQSNPNDLQVYGYFQVNYDQVYSNSVRSQHGWGSFNLQQLNLMLTKEFTPGLSTFINFEVTNTYSSEQTWGSFSLQEAWVKYKMADDVNLKAGLLIPAFNNLNEVKNRTPLLPYILRPIIYESAISTVFDFHAFLPEQAFFQIYGALNESDINIDFAAYVGNSDPAFINSAPGYQVRGIDTTSSKMVGGRVGIRTGKFKVGVSGTADKSNANQPWLGLGNVSRFRVGGDMSFEISGVTWELEIVHVLHSLSAEQAAAFALVPQFNPEIGGSFDKVFYYGIVNWDMNDKIYAYVGYNYFKDRLFAQLDNGIEGLTLGGGFRATQSTVLKVQGSRYQSRDLALLNFKEDHVMIALSVFF